ncbi:MAG TPA: ribosome maturation factor RimP [Acidimicrobiales bacterium]|nr:ribosome maturation factor RimP [Acidimicrobiales bacterium]
MGSAEEIEAVVAPAVAAACMDLVDVELLPGVVRISVDHDGGVDVDVLGPLSRTISNLIDTAGVGPSGHYDLEVSSPGVERNLRKPDHFRNAIGQRVKIRTKPGTEGERRAEGELAEATDTAVRLTGEHLATGERWIDYEDIERARTVFDWERALKESKAESNKAARRRERRGEQEGSGDSEPAIGETEPETGRERAARP